MSGAPRDNGMRQLLETLRTPAIGKFTPLQGLACGAVAGVVYWLAAQLWPSNVALVLSILTGALLTLDVRTAAGERGIEIFGLLFYVLLKFNVLMSLSAAHLAFEAPANAALCLIMVCGYGAARSSLVFLVAARTPRDTPALMSHADFALALALGYAPALLLGMPGLMGLAAALAASIAMSLAPRGLIDYAPWIAEICFYLGAQASWSYV